MICTMPECQTTAGCKCQRFDANRAIIASTTLAYDLNERIVAAALRVGSLTISAPPPARHHTLLNAMYDLGRMIGPDHQGFITSSGRYVGREEALKIALAARHTDAPKYQPHQLFSEDLW